MVHVVPSPELCTNKRNFKLIRISRISWRGGAHTCQDVSFPLFLFHWLTSASWDRQVLSCHGPCWHFLPQPSHALLPRLREFRGHFLSDLEFSMQLFSLLQRLSLSTFSLRLNSSVTFYERPSQPLGLSGYLSFLPGSPRTQCTPPFTLLTLSWCDCQHPLSLPNCRV